MLQKTISKRSAYISLFLIFLFVFFIYGLLLLGLRNLAERLIVVEHWSNLAALGDLGIMLVVLGFLGGWAMCFLIPAALVNFVCRKQYKIRLATKINTVLFFAVFHIFAFPFVLWPQVRLNFPWLYKRHYKALRAKVLKTSKDRALERLYATKN